MLNNNKVIAMILAGGKGTRLEALTKKIRFLYWERRKMGT